MSDFPLFPQISPDDVFERIGAGATAITPNRRLASALKGAFNRHQIQQGKAVWFSGDILPFNTLIERIHSDTLYSKRSFPFPLLLSDVQEQVLWESVIRTSEVGKTLLRLPQTAQMAREAWQIAHAWRLISRLGDFSPNEDGKAFLDWAESYRKITAEKQLTDHARICDLITEHYESLEIKKPFALICYGFDLITPQQAVFFAKLARAGCEIVTVNRADEEHKLTDNVRRVSYLISREEMHQAALWARSRIDGADPEIRIGIVVPALAERRDALIRIFNAVMLPDVRLGLPGAARPVVPFNVSLGARLSSYPVIDAALTVLHLVGGEIEFSRVSYWMRSPFLRGAENEMTQRALLDWRIRRYAEPVITLEQLLTLIQQADGQNKCPVLLQCLTAIAACRQTQLPASAGHAVFARLFTEILQVSGFPGERSLDSNEYQTVQKWQSLLAEFLALDQVNAEVMLHEAINRLEWMAGNMLFQPETPSAPIQILGVLEAAGMTFDYLWVMGLSDDQWPLRARPNPFLPLELQRATGMPSGSAQESSLFCQRIMRGWLSDAKEVVLSSPELSDDRDQQTLKPSALIQSWPERHLIVPESPSYRDLIARSCEMEQVEDSQALPLAKEQAQEGIQGGTTVIKDFAACPFRAWAKHRLHIESFRTPHTGLDALERGSLAHQALADLWRHLKTKEALDGIGNTDLDNLLTAIASNAVSGIQQVRPSALSKRLMQIEQRRLTRLLHEWLIEEKQRDSFTVVAIEEKCFIQLGDLKLSARLDRIDELASGQLIIIDYKTSRQSIQSMLGERPDEPQLLLYLVSAGKEKLTAGIAFAVVKSGEMGFVAIVRDSEMLPGVKAFSQLPGCKHFNTWEDLIETWRRDLTDLAEGFCAGDARVDPKNFPVTCNHCDMQMFCRLYDRMNQQVCDEGSGYAGN